MIRVPFFVKNYERPCTWAALCERSYGGIGFDCDGILGGLIKAKADVRSTTKNAHTQVKRTFFMRKL